MYRFENKKALAWVAVVAVVVFAFFAWYQRSDQTAQEGPTVQELAVRINTLESQLSEMKTMLSALQDEVSAAVSSDTTSNGEEPATKAVVTASYLKVRKKPDSNALHIGTLTEDSQVQILERQGEWSKIEFRGKEETVTGWVANRYLRLIE